MKYKFVILTFVIIIGSCILIKATFNRISHERDVNAYVLVKETRAHNLIFEQYDFMINPNPYTGNDIQKLFELVVLNNIENSDKKYKQIALILNNENIAIYPNIELNFDIENLNEAIIKSKGKIYLNKMYNVENFEYDAQTGFVCKIVVNEV